jgi:peptidoglycan-associated lipoprotein
MKKLNLFGTIFISAIMLSAVTGCHRHPQGVTPIPDYGNQNHPTPGVNPNDNTSSGTAIPSTPGPTATAEGTPEGDYGKWANILNDPNSPQDREKFKEDTVYFDFDSATIKSSEESKLADIANFFKSDEKDALIIEGNCDERGTEKYNLSLGERRALATREYLANLGVNAQRIKTITYGASKPVDPGHNEAAWKQNRRDDFVLVMPK